MSAGECGCEGWGCRRCAPQPDAGEQGLTVEEKELVLLRGRVRQLERDLERDLRVHISNVAEIGHLKRRGELMRSSLRLVGGGEVRAVLERDHDMAVRFRRKAARRG